MEENSILYNKMLGSGFIVPTTISHLDSEIILGKTDTLDAEVTVRIIRKNRMRGRVRILRMVPDSKIIDNNVEDTYVRQTLPYMSFKDSNVLKSGMLNGEDFFGMLRFNDLTDILDKTGPQLLTLKLVVKPVDKVIQNISLYELDKAFKSYNVSYENHPSISEKIGDMEYDVFKNEYKIDITRYAKQIIDGLREHNGFTFISDKPVNIYSSESEYGRPKLIMEYIDPNKFQSENEIPAEIGFLESVGLNVELDLENPYPVLNSELTFSKDSVPASVLLAETIGLDAEINIAPTIGEKAVNSELVFSQDSALSEINFSESQILNSEVEYIPPDESVLDSEVDIRMFSARPAVVNLAFPGDSVLNVELTCYNYGIETLDSEITLSNKFGSILNANVALYTLDNLDAEMKLFVKDKEEILNVELEFTRNMIPAKVRFSPSEILNAELSLAMKNELESEVKFEIRSTLDACVSLYTNSDLESEVNLAFPGQSYINAELEYVDVNVLNACVSLYTNSGLDSETNLALVGASDLQASVMYVNGSTLNAELIIYSQNALDAEVDVLFDSGLDSCVNLYTEIQLNACVSLYTDTKLDAEMNILLIGMDTIESEVVCLPISKLNAEVLLQETGSSELDACISLYTDSYVDSEVKFALNDESFISAQVEVYKQSYVYAEIVFIKELHSELNCELVFLDGEQTTLDSEVILNVTTQDELDSELVYLRIENITLDAEMNLMFVDSNYINSEMILRLNSTSEIDAQMKLLLVSNIDSEVIYLKQENTTIDAEMIFRDIEESYIDAEITLVKKLRAKITVIER